MNNKKILAIALIFILLMIIFRNFRNLSRHEVITKTTKTQVVYTNPYYHHNVTAHNNNNNHNYHHNAYKAQYYN